MIRLAYNLLAIIVEGYADILALTVIPGINGGKELLFSLHQIGKLGHNLSTV